MELDRDPSYPGTAPWPVPVTMRKQVSNALSSFIVCILRFDERLDRLFIGAPFLA